MNINEYILAAFSPILRKSKFTKILSDSLTIRTANGALVEVTRKEITLVHKVNLLDKIKSVNTKTDIVDVQKIRNFYKNLKVNLYD